MPGRIDPPAGAVNRYKYGFNGKENDNETVGTGEGTQDYGMRIYNPSLGKFLSVDPLTKGYPMLTPYQFSSNRPIDGIDLDGLEYNHYVTGLEFNDPEQNVENATRIIERVGVQTHTGQAPLANLFGWKSMHTILGDYNIPIMDKAYILLFDDKHYMFRTFSDLQKAAYSIDWQSYLEGKGANSPLLNDKKTIEYYSHQISVLAEYAGYAGMVMSFTQMHVKIGRAKVDVMSGANPTKGYKGYDKVENPGIVDDIANFSKHYGPNSVESIIVNNPQAEFLGQVSPSMEAGGTITIRGGMSNKFFNKIYNATEIEGYEIIKRTEDIPNINFKQSDGITPVKGKINEIILKRN